MKDIEKEALVRFLMEKDELVLKTAIYYAESYLRYGVDVTEKWDTAVKQTYALHQAERKGYFEAMQDMEKQKQENE